MSSPCAALGSLEERSAAKYQYRPLSLQGNELPGTQMTAKKLKKELIIRGRNGLQSVLKVNIADTFIIIAFTTAQLLGGSRQSLNYVFFAFFFFFFLPRD